MIRFGTKRFLHFDGEFLGQETVGDGIVPRFLFELVQIQCGDAVDDGENLMAEKIKGNN